MGPSVKTLVNEFFNNHFLQPNINDITIILIPKRKNPTTVTDYRPISLCNVSYKIIAKMLVNRIRPFLNNLISPYQNAFVPGRQITDNILMAHEFLHTLHSKRKGKIGHMALKLDIEKAYDNLSWDFLHKTLQAFNFPPDFISLIMTCVTTVSFTVTANGHHSKLHGTTG